MVDSTTEAFDRVTRLIEKRMVLALDELEAVHLAPMVQEAWNREVGAHVPIPTRMTQSLQSHARRTLMLGAVRRFCEYTLRVGTMPNPDRLLDMLSSDVRAAFCAGCSPHGSDRN